MSVEWKVFLEAIEIDNPEQRASFLNQACANDHVRARVEKMLAFDPNSSFLGEAEVSREFSQRVPENPSALLGKSIGRYSLREVIGEGGFGVVYRAEQTAPIQRAVALKVIKLGMDTRQVIARFEAERQVLALMDHPNIAKVHDGGTSDTGRPYFVMELVEGLPITRFCDEKQLSPIHRLRLVAQVCRAVHHAHQKGIIHRDIKPSNVLVATQDNEPAPKIIDFGIAKATHPTSSGHAAVTRFQQLVGTPAYMSPEHFAEDNNDVDTRSDVYSIGVMLYELLTGTTPVREDTLRRSTFEQIGRHIRDHAFSTPSSRLRSLGNELNSVAVGRGTDPSSLIRFTKGELDWIVMKALERDRARRYDSAVALAADLEAFLKHEPITAASPSLGYRSQKFLQRRWKLVSLVFAAFILLLLSSVLSMVSSLSASRQLDRNQKLMYASDVSFSADAIASGNIELAANVLLNHKDSDLRSFPWNYMWRQLHQFEARFDHGTPVHDVVFSDDGTSLISLGESGRVWIWSLTDDASHLIECGMSTTMTGAISGDVLAVGGRFRKAWESDGVVELWNWTTRERTGELDLGVGTGCIVGLEFIPNSSTLLVASVDHLAAYDIESGAKRWQFDSTAVGYHGTETRGLAVSQNGELIATSNRDTGIVILNSETGEQLGKRVQLPSVRCLRFLGDGKHLAVSQLLPTNVDSIRIIDLDTQVVLTLSESTVTSESIDCLPTENLLASINWRGEAAIWDLRTKTQVGSVPAHANAPGAVKFSPDGETLATCGHDGTVKLWRTKKLVTRIASPPTPIRETVGWYAFSNDNRSIVSSAKSQYPKRWDIESGQLLTEYTALPATLTSAPHTVFSPDDRLLAAIDTENRVIIWDAMTGELNAQLQLKTANAHAQCMLAFSSDGNRLSVSGLDKLRGGAFAVRIQEWDLATGDLSDGSNRTTFSAKVTPNSSRTSGFPHFRIRGGGWRDRMRLSPRSKALGIRHRLPAFLGRHSHATCHSCRRNGSCDCTGRILARWKVRRRRRPITQDSRLGHRYLQACHRV